MRVRSTILAALMALAAPSALHAADMSGYYPTPGCAGLQPVDTYVPPQTAYIVACTIPLPERPYAAPVKHGHGHLAKLWNHGHADTTEYAVQGISPIGPYGPHATHDAAMYEGKLVYLRQWSADRPPVHFLVVPK